MAQQKAGISIQTSKSSAQKAMHSYRSRQEGFASDALTMIAQDALERT